jgi:hypothetical protein
MPCLITMSQPELHRLEAVQKIRERRLTVARTAELLHLSRSQVHRLFRPMIAMAQTGLYQGSADGPATGVIPTIFVIRSSIWCARIMRILADACRREAGGMASDAPLSTWLIGEREANDGFYDEPYENRADERVAGSGYKPDKPIGRKGYSLPKKRLSLYAAHPRCLVFFSAMT